jgi:hypothetical protein
LSVANGAPFAKSRYRAPTCMAAEVAIATSRPADRADVQATARENALSERSESKGSISLGPSEAGRLQPLRDFV